jgi:hypothetical protein
MKQHEAVAQAMRENGGYATLGHLYRTAIKVTGCEWGTKTPFASIRRIVQQNPAFFKIKPGLWALTESRESVLRKFALTEDTSPKKNEEFSHSYYQGLIVEIGNLKKYETFIPNQDKNKPFLSRKLSDVSTLRQFHKFTYDHVLRRAQTIDVSWFNERGMPNAFFEIEHSTDIQNSLLKFLELQDFRVKFHIVSDAARRKEFQGKISYTAFRPISSFVAFIDYETLSSYHSKVSESAALEEALNF